MAGWKRLPELSEGDAPAEIKEIYDEIKVCCGVPMVALIYRYLATQDGLLEWSWRALAPAMRSGALSAAAEELASVRLAAELPLLTFEKAEVLGLKPIDRAAIAYIVTAYNTANTHNIIAVHSLMALLTSGTSGGQNCGDSCSPSLPTAFPTLPPLVQLEDMPPALAEQVLRLRVARDTGLRGIVPTLYRHLAHWPDYLMDQASALESLFKGGQIEDTAKRITAGADAAVDCLYKELLERDPPEGGPAGVAREELQATLAAFAATIPEMITVGRLMSAALPQD